MEYLNLDDEAIGLNENESNSDNNINKNNEKGKFSLSNPIFTEMINFTLINDDIEYEFQITYKNEKWMIKRNLSEIKNLIVTLQNLKYIFISENYFKNISISSYEKNQNIKEININILNFLRYINYRFDLLSNVVTRDFFSFDKSTEPEEILNLVKRDNIEQIFNFKIEESDMTLSDFSYDSELGLLVIALEDLSYMSRIGRFWSLVDYEILGNCFIFQRVFDKDNQPYFRKFIAKNFDARVSKIEMNKSHNKIYVGLENGAIQIFNISIVEPNKYKKTTTVLEKIIAITEGNNFRYLSDRITGFATYSDFLFISSKENKIIIVDINTSIPDVKFNGSIKKRIYGKGYLADLKIDENLKKLFLVTITDKILIYDIILINKFSDTETSVDIKIEFLNEIDTISNIKDAFIKGFSLFVALENKIQIFNLNTNGKNNKDNDNLIPLDGSLPDGISYSSKYIKFDYANYISAICYFTDMKLIMLGLINGSIIAFNSRSIEIIFAKKISEHPIKKLILLEENYIIIAGDEKGNVYFFKFGI
jgi:hypothetical protein